MTDTSKKKVVHADPTKDFFIKMITRDITLEDCIFDLLDNCLDGANREVMRQPDEPEEERRYEGYSANISFDENRFCIADNCGGISLTNAINYAFHFGRRTDAPEDIIHGIGLYGIGMKRAIFKIGRDITVESFTREDAFAVRIDVEKWAKNEKDWDFDLEDRPKRDNFGTTITITQLNEGTSTEFQLPVFKNSLIKGIARDYSFLLQKGFVIEVGDQKVAPFPFGLRKSESFEPIRERYSDESGVDVEIYAGLAGYPPDDTSPDMRLEDVEYWGWFVLCNDRIVIGGDKTDRTVWGDGQFPVWHGQYNGFTGVVSFRAADPAKLPWTTTKRDIEKNSPLYRRAIARMKEATRPYLTYTSERREELEKAKALEKETRRIPLRQLNMRATMLLPTFAPRPKIQGASISYQRPVEKVSRAKHALGNISMTNKAVGEATFDYYYDNEVED